MQYISVHLRARICPFACIRISTVYFYALLCMHACVCILVPLCAETCWVYLCVARSGCLLHALSTCCCVCIPPYRDQWVLKLKMCLGVAALLTSDRPHHATMHFTSYPSLYRTACGWLCSSRRCKHSVCFLISASIVTVGSSVLARSLK